MLIRWDRFAYAILAADEIVAVSNAVAFKYDDGRTFLSWRVGDSVDPAVCESNSLTKFYVLLCELQS